MEVSQFTYFQQVGGFEVEPVSGEMTYGLERLAMYLQNVDLIDLPFNGPDCECQADLWRRVPAERAGAVASYNFEAADTEMLIPHFADAEKECGALG